MANASEALLLLCLLFYLLTSLSHARSCRSQSFPNNQMFSSCMDLPVLQSSIHWNYHPSGNTVQMAYRRNDVPASTWIAWAINPTSTGMVGSQAFVAFKEEIGLMNVYTTQITSYQPLMQPGSLSFPVPDLSVVQQSSDITIFATIQLPSNTTTVSQIWQEGTLAGNNPSAHNSTGDNLKSFGSIDFGSGKADPTPSSTVTAPAFNFFPPLKYTHGVLNVMGWGILLPVGVMLGRNLKAMGPAWFYFHMICQFFGCVIGSVGWGTGMTLGNKSQEVQYTIHRYAGSAIFIASAIQFAAAAYGSWVKLAPSTKPIWNKFHRCCGYAIIFVAIVNIFEGFDILQPRMKWKAYYTIAIAGLGVITILLELCTQCPKPSPAAPATQAASGAAPATQAASSAAPATQAAAGSSTKNQKK